MIPGCNLEITVRRANQIREMISSKIILTPYGTTNVTVSMGVTVAEASSNTELLLRDADSALYQAKRNGRNRVEQLVVNAAAAKA